MIKRILTLYGLILILMLTIQTITKTNLFPPQLKADNYVNEWGSSSSGFCPFCGCYYFYGTCCCVGSGYVGDGYGDIPAMHGDLHEVVIEFYPSFQKSQPPAAIYSTIWYYYFDFDLLNSMAPAGTSDNSPITDCAGVIYGRAYVDRCGNCVGGTTGNYPCKPMTKCDEINYILTNSNVQSQYDALCLKQSSGATIEWGTEINATFSNIDDWLHYTGLYSVTSPDIRPGEAHGFTPNWADNSSSFTRAIGYMHIHPTDGTCFSPADLNPLLTLRYDINNIEARSYDAIAVAITPSTAYTLKINDWTKFRDFDTSILSGLAADYQTRVDNQNETQENIFLDLYINNPAMKGVFQLFKNDGHGIQMSVNKYNGITTYEPCQ